MLDNDNLTYSYQRRSVNNSAERALISLERSQKLDLLIHLLANLQQSLIVCGPQGIGKTTLLETMRQNRKDLWDIALLQASANSSFESLVIDVLRELNINKGSAFDIAALRDACARQKVVLLIDDAGNLGPGLMTMLIELADSLPGLRLVFAMSHDEFHIKSGTDKVVEDCHFIELPPLSKKQCGEFLQNLSAQPGALISFNAITDSLVDDVYQDTHGIPGKILAALPKLANYQSRKTVETGLWLAIGVVVVGAGVVFKSLLPQDAAESHPTQISAVEPTVKVPPPLNPAEPVVPAKPAPEPLPNAAEPANKPIETLQQPPAPIESIISTPAVMSEPAPEPKPEPKVEEHAPVAAAPDSPSQAVSAPPTVPDVQPKKSEPPVVAEPAVAPVAAPPVPAKPAEWKAVKPATEGDNQSWIMSQPPGNFTLQVMVLSNKAAVTRFLKKYADYSDGLKYYPINKGELEKYVLIYGSFATAAEAQQLKAIMPGEFKQALEKRFRAVQKESRR